MRVQFAAFLVMVATGVVGFAKPNDQLEKDRESIKALFDGIPMDLRAKVKDNPVRCDRANDWLRENIVGKGKSIEVHLSVEKVFPVRDKDGTYLIRLAVAPAIFHALGDNWAVTFTHHGAPAREHQFYFENVNAADAEKLADSKHVKIQGKVKGVALSRFPEPHASMRIILEDVLVDGRKWTPSDKAVGGFGKGGFPFGGDDPGKAKKGKGK